MSVCLFKDCEVKPIKEIIVTDENGDVLYQNPIQTKNEDEFESWYKQYLEERGFV